MSDDERTVFPADLLERARQVLRELERTSSGTTTSWAGITSADARSERVLPAGLPESGHDPGSAIDPPHLEYQRRFEQCRTSEKLEGAIDDAEAELKQIRRRKETDNVGTADDIQLMLSETRGWTPEEVQASRWKTSARVVRKARRDANLNPENGNPIEDDRARPDRGTVALDDRRCRAQEMAGKGMTTRQIAMHLGEHQTQVVRWLKRAA